MVAQYVHYSEAYIRVEGLTVEVDVVDRHALASILTWRHLVGDLLCESHRNLTLPIALSAHHEPLAAIEFVKGGAHRGDPALIAQVEFHAYGVTSGERLHYCVTLRTSSSTTTSECPPAPPRIGPGNAPCPIGCTAQTAFGTLPLSVKIKRMTL